MCTISTHCGLPHVLVQLPSPPPFPSVPLAEHSGHPSGLTLASQVNVGTRPRPACPLLKRFHVSPRWMSVPGAYPIGPRLYPLTSHPIYTSTRVWTYSMRSYNSPLCKVFFSLSLVFTVKKQPRSLLIYFAHGSHSFPCLALESKLGVTCWFHP